MPRRPLAPLLLSAPATLLAGDAVATPGAPGTDARHRAGAAASRPRPLGPPTPGRLYAALAGVALTLGALTLLAPSTPSYDPWSWTVWGREIIHGGLVITDTGTSWKPLPMILTIPFALFGHAAPDLWLAVARAGAIAGVLLAGRLAYRLVRALDADAGRTAAVLGGLVALIGLGFAARGDYITSNGLGYSEALAAALLLAAVECGLDGRHRAAFSVGFLVALDRPEVWAFWVPYGLWLARRDPPMRAFVLGAFLLQPIAWFLPVYLGSGHLGSSVTRATHPRSNSLAFASDPFLAELGQAAWPTMMLRVKVMAGLVVLAWPAWALRARRAPRDGSGPRAGVPYAWSVAAGLGLAGLAWFVIIAVMTEIGFSGNNRYLVLGAALVDVGAGVGFGALALALARGLRRPGVAEHPRCPGLVCRIAPTIGVGLAAAAFALLPAWIENRDFVNLPATHRALLYQAHLRDSLPRAIALAGGRDHVLACGRVMTEGFQVPMVAYALDVPTSRILAPPHSRRARGPLPGVILQTQATQSSTRLPFVRYWRPSHYTYHGAAGPWRTFTHCA